MRRGAGIILTIAVALVVVLSLVFVKGTNNRTGETAQFAPGEPGIAIVSPRNGARESQPAVVVKVDVRNFRLSPRGFGGEPLLGEGSLRFSLNEVPACVSPVAFRRIAKNPEKGRVVGRSFDYPRFSGPNGVLAERIGSAGAYSPATEPEIYYRELPPGFYRLIVVLGQNNGVPTGYHSVTNFEILPPAGRSLPPCPPGTVPSPRAAAFSS